MDSEYRQEESIATTSASVATRRMNENDESPLMTIHKSIQVYMNFQSIKFQIDIIKII
jgi:hypothetical protein